MEEIVLLGGFLLWMVLVMFSIPQWEWGCSKLEPKEALDSSLALWVPLVVSLALNPWQCSFWEDKVTQFLVHYSSLSYGLQCFILKEFTLIGLIPVLHSSSSGKTNGSQWSCIICLLHWGSCLGRDSRVASLGPVLCQHFSLSASWTLVCELSSVMVDFPLYMQFSHPPRVHVCTYSTESHVLITCIPWIYQLFVQIGEYLQLN